PSGRGNRRCEGSCPWLPAVPVPSRPPLHVGYRGILMNSRLIGKRTGGRGGTRMTSTPPNATDLAGEHRSGRRDIRTTVKAALARAHELQGPYNAFVTLADDLALARAEELARDVDAGRDSGS